MNNIQFILIKYANVADTLNRKFILALKTYRMMKHQFIKSINHTKIHQKCPSIDLLK